MKVKSKFDKNKVISGITYITDRISSDCLSIYTTEMFRLGWYKKSDFTEENGNEITITNYIDQSPPYWGDEVLKPGDIVVCLTNKNYKYLVEGGKYRIKDFIKGSNNWNNSFRLEGYNRKLNWTTRLFRKLTTQELRDIAINQIFDKEENFSVEFVRKIEQTKNKDKELILALSKSISDKSRHHLGVIDWSVEKSSKNLYLKSSDFDHLLDMKLSDILKILD